MGALGLLLALTGCGTSSFGEQPASPLPATASESAANGIAGDTPPHYAENHRYRTRTTLSESARARVEPERLEAQRRLDALAEPREVNQVLQILTSVQAWQPWVDRAGDGTIRFDAEVAETACLVGALPPKGDAQVRAEGFVLDGGCHALSGH